MATPICPNCNKKLDGLLTSRYLISDAATTFINNLSEDKAKAYCNSCATPLIQRYLTAVKMEIEMLNNKLQPKLHLVPILTTHQPANWDYDPIGIVSAQSVSGTGLLSEISSSWADFLGSQSDALSNKLLNGENLCKNKLRFSALQLGGNAVIATDIDYSEVGGGKGMLMVCMAGTAVVVKSWSDNFAFVKDEIDELSIQALRLAELNRIKVPALS